MLTARLSLSQLGFVSAKRRPQVRQAIHLLPREPSSSLLDLPNTLGSKQDPLFHCRNNETIEKTQFPTSRKTTISQSYLLLGQWVFFTEAIP